MIKKNKFVLVFLLLPFFCIGQIKAGESSFYNFSWLDPEKEVYVLQNRKFRKKRKVFLSAGVGQGLSGSFVQSNQIQARLGFFFAEDYGISFLYSKNYSKENQNVKAVTTERPFRRLVQDYTGAMVLWSPFYSKANFFNKIFYYDFIIGIGFGKLNEKNNRKGVKSKDPKSPDESGSYQGPFFDLEMKFFITEWLNSSINVNSVYYKDDDLNKKNKIYYNQWDLTFSVGVMF